MLAESSVKLCKAQAKRADGKCSLGQTKGHMQRNTGMLGIVDILSHCVSTLTAREKVTDVFDAAETSADTHTHIKA